MIILWLEHSANQGILSFFLSYTALRLSCLRFFKDLVSRECLVGDKLFLNLKQRRVIMDAREANGEHRPVFNGLKHFLINLPMCTYPRVFNH